MSQVLVAIVGAGLAHFLIGSFAAIAFGFMPRLRDRVWANRPWSAILIDARYQCVARTLAGTLAAVVLTMMAQ